MSTDDESPELVSFATTRRAEKAPTVAGTKRPRSTAAAAPLRIGAVPLPANVLANLHNPDMAPTTQVGGKVGHAAVADEEEGEEDDSAIRAARSAAARNRSFQVACAAAEENETNKLIVK